MRRTCHLFTALIGFAIAFGTESVSAAAHAHAHVAPVANIAIEGRPLAEFLQWASIKTGRKLVLTDDVTRHQVLIIQMHGSIRGLTVMEALNAVMEASSMRFDMRDGELRVTSARPVSAPVTGT
jgi:hypothetical protein